MLKTRPFDEDDFRVRDSWGRSACTFDAGCVAENTHRLWVSCITSKVLAPPDSDGSMLAPASASKRSLYLKRRLVQATTRKAAVAQRAWRRERFTRLHARVRNRGKDAKHTFSAPAALAAFAACVGNVSARFPIRDKRAPVRP